MNNQSKQKKLEFISFLVMLALFICLVIWALISLFQFGKDVSQNPGKYFPTKVPEYTSTYYIGISDGFFQFDKFMDGDEYYCWKKEESGYFFVTCIDKETKEVVLKEKTNYFEEDISIKK